MKYFSAYFWICLTIFTLNQLVEKAGIFIPYVHSYLDDTLAPGIVMGFALAFQQQLTFRNKSYVFSIGHIIFFVVWYALLFELVFPYFDPRHYADVMDVVAYALGGMLFYKTGNRPSYKLLLKPYQSLSAEKR